MKPLKGIFISDIHFPENIRLQPVFDYIKDYKPDTIIIGGDVIDAKELHGVESMPAKDFKMKWYERDCRYLKDFFLDLKKISSAKLVFLEGNHEQRYDRLARKYPDAFKRTINLKRDCGTGIKWIEYGTYKSYYRLGDTVFMHGTVYPDNHAKKYALDHTPLKCVYGHLHHFQAYTTKRAFASSGPRYAITPGCLCTITPEWKRGVPHQWLHGFLSFVIVNGRMIPTVHQIEQGRFYANNKLYC